MLSRRERFVGMTGTNVTFRCEDKRRLFVVVMGADFVLSRNDPTCSSSAACLRSDLVVGLCQLHGFGSIFPWKNRL